MRIIRLDSTESTNKYCKLLELDSVEEFTVVWTPRQTAGVGQRGSHWESEPHKNLTFSIVLHPSFLRAEEQFGITMALSLAIKSYLATINSNGIAIGIKWPNDIYVCGNKICGTLIESTISQQRIATAVCGIGLNVNQTTFPDWVPNPTSMANEWGCEYDIENNVLPDLVQHIATHYAMLRNGSRKDMEQQYYASLINYQRTARYLYHGNAIEATISGIDRFGRLLLTQSDGTEIISEVKEIVFLDILNS